jgi:hypothetical protein
LRLLQNFKTRYNQKNLENKIITHQNKRHLKQAISTLHAYKTERKVSRLHWLQINFRKFNKINDYFRNADKTKVYVSPLKTPSAIMPLTSRTVLQQSLDQNHRHILYPIAKYLFCRWNRHCQNKRNIKSVLLFIYNKEQRHSLSQWRSRVLYNREKKRSQLYFLHKLLLEWKSFVVYQRHKRIILKTSFDNIKRISRKGRIANSLKRMLLNIQTSAWVKWSTIIKQDQNVLKKVNELILRNQLKNTWHDMKITLLSIRHFSKIILKKWLSIWRHNKTSLSSISSHLKRANTYLYHQKWNTFKSQIDLNKSLRLKYQMAIDKSNCRQTSSFIKSLKVYSINIRVIAIRMKYLEQSRAKLFLAKSIRKWRSYFNSRKQYLSKLKNGLSSNIDNDPLKRYVYDLLSRTFAISATTSLPQCTAGLKLFLTYFKVQKSILLRDREVDNPDPMKLHLIWKNMLNENKDFLMYVAMSHVRLKFCLQRLFYNASVKRASKIMDAQVVKHLNIFKLKNYFESMCVEKKWKKYVSSIVDKCFYEHFRLSIKNFLVCSKQLKQACTKGDIFHRNLSVKKCFKIWFKITRKMVMKKLRLTAVINYNNNRNKGLVMLTLKILAQS